jgi:RimJ/RimL family protein N-acetyltransferase
MAVSPSPVTRVFPALPAASDGLLLRPFTRDDGPAVLAAAADPLMLHWLALSQPLEDASAVKRWIRNGHALATRGDGLRLAVTEQRSGRLQGCVELCIDATGLGVAAYWTVPSERRRGVATAALVALCDWAFTHQLVWAIDLLTMPGNLASERVAVSAGFVRDGTFTCYDRRPDCEVTFNVFTREASSVGGPDPAV